MGINREQLKYDMSQNNWLFVVFFIYNFYLSFTALYYLSHAKKLSDFLPLNCSLDMSFHFYFNCRCFLMLSATVKEWKFYSFRCRFVLPSQQLSRFCVFKFSRLLSRGKEKKIYNFLFSYHFGIPTLVT